MANQQTIVYCLHPSIGHLGIFVSASVANREHTELFCALDLIDVLPPGLYEAKIEDVAPGTSHRDLIEGRYLVRFERRTIDDILALDDGREDERPFEVVRRVAEINQHLYDTYASPFVRAAATEVTAEAIRETHPSRMERKLASDANPLMAWVGALAPMVREHRQPVSADNPFLAMQAAMSDQIVTMLNQYRDARDAWQEQWFESLYATPWLPAMLGMETTVRRAESPAILALRAEVRTAQARGAGARGRGHLARRLHTHPGLRDAGQVRHRGAAVQPAAQACARESAREARHAGAVQGRGLAPELRGEPRVRLRRCRPSRRSCRT